MSHSAPFKPHHMRWSFADDSATLFVVRSDSLAPEVGDDDVADKWERSQDVARIAIPYLIPSNFAAPHAIVLCASDQLAGGLLSIDVVLDLELPGRIWPAKISWRLMLAGQGQSRWVALRRVFRFVQYSVLISSRSLWGSSMSLSFGCIPY